MRSERRFELVAAEVMRALPRRGGQVQPAVLARGDYTAGVKPFGPAVGRVGARAASAAHPASSTSL
jgi:hypothetical protein